MLMRDVRIFNKDSRRVDFVKMKFFDDFDFEILWKENGNCERTPGLLPL